MSKYIYVLLLLSACCTLLGSCDKSSNSSATGTPAGAGGSLAKFAIVGNYLYMVDSHNLSVIDISNPAAPVNKGEVFAGFDIQTIFPYNNKLFLGSAEGLYIYNVADPVNPVQEAAVTHFRACDPVVTNDTVSYVTLRNNNSGCGSTKNVLQVYNVKDIRSPVLVTEVSMNAPYGLGISRNALYVCEADSGMSVFNLADPYHPVKTATIKGDLYYDVIPYGDVLIAFIDKGVSFFDIKDPLNIVKAGLVTN